MFFNTKGGEGREATHSAEKWYRHDKENKEASNKAERRWAKRKESEAKTEFEQRRHKVESSDCNFGTYPTLVGGFFLCVLLGTHD